MTAAVGFAPGRTRGLRAAGTVSWVGRSRSSRRGGFASTVAGECRKPFGCCRFDDSGRF
ncbi:hypothetical protein C731_3611 [Mycolicibacterium hassiacum DSM 44199]|uniref:Uncharacterized protein n=1 Tax=Mycolicibacterium hassiacum (strain DSM 44199 / CIP 105218 / JCM 12690 / 3849) TaxID=1122247 RepID=K5BJ38_MYCHD|nr:hypothetical protein C731_3611 [Mycolicibacterium hassiacum DSM 44199]